MNVKFQRQYMLNIDETAQTIGLIGKHVTTIVEGDMGNGKSALMNIVGNLPDYVNHRRIMVDCTTMSDSGDLFMIKYSDDGQTFTTVPHNKLGFLLKDDEGNQLPVLIMFDEIGKANRSVLNASLRILYEKKYDDYALHEDSVVFATTNLTAESLGDLIPPHGVNRTCVIRMRKDIDCFLAHALKNNMHDMMMSWVYNNPSCMKSFIDCDSVEDAEFIYHPDNKGGQTNYVTSRQLERVSRMMYLRDESLAMIKAGATDEEVPFSSKMFHAVLIGLVGENAAASMVAHIELDKQLPNIDEIKANPTTAMLPKSGAASSILIYKVLSTIERKWAAQWMQYLDRLPPVAQSLFGNAVNTEGYDRVEIVTQTLEYQDWARRNSHMIAK